MFVRALGITVATPVKLIFTESLLPDIINTKFCYTQRKCGESTTTHRFRKYLFVIEPLDFHPQSARIPFRSSQPTGCSPPVTMKFLRTLLFVTLAVQESALVNAFVIDKRQITVDVTAWLSKQTPLSWTGLYRNIGNTGDYAKNVDPGCVIASPSTSSPD